MCHKRLVVLPQGIHPTCQPPLGDTRATKQALCRKTWCTRTATTRLEHSTSVVNLETKIIESASFSWQQHQPASTKIVLRMIINLHKACPHTKIPSRLSHPASSSMNISNSMMRILQHTEITRISLLTALDLVLLVSRKRCSKTGCSRTLAATLELTKASTVMVSDHFVTAFRADSFSDAVFHPTSFSHNPSRPVGTARPAPNFYHKPAQTFRPASAIGTVNDFNQAPPSAYQPTLLADLPSLRDLIPPLHWLIV